MKEVLVHVFIYTQPIRHIYVMVFIVYIKIFIPFCNKVQLLASEVPLHRTSMILHWRLRPRYGHIVVVG